MPLLTAAPILAFLEQQPTITFYEKLGFTCNANWDGYLMFHRDQISIHLWRCDDENIPKNTGCYIYVDEINNLKYGSYLKWISLKTPDNLRL